MSIAEDESAHTFVPLESVVEDAAELAHRWAAATAEGQTAQEERTSAQLGALLADSAGLDLAVRFVDRVARPEDLRVAAKELGQLSASTAGSFLSAVDRTLLGAGALVARLAPDVVVPLARKRLRQLVGHLVVDAHDRALREHLSRAHDDGFRLNINLLGEAVLGESEARSRAERTLALLNRDDVDYVSIKVSSLVSQISTWDTPGTVERVLKRLRPLMRAAAAKGAFVNLDMEEYRDLDLTLEVFTQLLSEQEFTGLEAGIVLQAYLPDTLAALRRLIDFAQVRRSDGGAGIKIRLVKGANLAMERVEAELHGWQQAPYPTKADVDANYVRLLDEALRPEASAAVRIGVASHNLFDVALALELARARGVGSALDVEMLQGMAPAQARAVQADLGDDSQLILYTPVVAPDDFDVAVSYLVRRLEENAAEENFLHALFSAGPGSNSEPNGSEASTAPSQASVDSRSRQSESPMADQEARFRASVAARTTLSAGRRREVDREPAGETFANTTDSDPALPATREAAREAVATAPRPLTSPVLHDVAEIDVVVARGRQVAREWVKVPARERAAILRTAADAIEERREQLVTQMAHEGGKTVAEADPEVSEAIDFARYYAQSVLDITKQEHDEGLAFTPHTLTLVTPPWNFPVAIPAGGILAALAAGSAVVIKPASPTPGCVEIVAEAIHKALADHGANPDVVQVVRTAGRETGSLLVAHDGVDAVILTGAYETSRKFSALRADRPEGPQVLGETSGKNALIVTPAADYDLAVADVVRSAFGHAGQKCSAASLLILVGSAAQSERFRRQLIDSVASLRVGWPDDLGTTMGPVIEEPQGKLLRALTRLDPGERWLVEPKELDGSGRLWSPGLKEGVRSGSFFHLTECFGPVLGIMTARTLPEAIELQNMVDYGLTSGLHSLDDEEIEYWSNHVEAGNLYINRHITGAIVQRQSFGGWKRSAVGPGAKAGGPNYVAQLGTWTERPSVDSGIGLSVGAPEPDDVVGLTQQEAEWLDAALRSDVVVLKEVFARETDLSGLASEANVFRYRPIPHVTIRAGAAARPAEVLRVALAAQRLGVPATISVAREVLARVQNPERLDWRPESDEAFAARVASGEVMGRVRVIGSAERLWPAANSDDADVTLLPGEVLLSGRRELLALIREQAISRTRHRFGHISAKPNTLK